jgi:hypothetical protein
MMHLIILVVAFFSFNGGPVLAQEVQTQEAKLPTTKQVKPKCVKREDLEAKAEKEVSANPVLSIVKEASTDAVADNLEKDLKEQGKSICPEPKTTKSE